MVRRTLAPRPHLAEIRPFPIALSAITSAFFALAQSLRKRKKDPAFSGILS
jgi:hypothetical protein